MNVPNTGDCWFTGNNPNGAPSGFNISANGLGSCLNIGNDGNITTNRLLTVNASAWIKELNVVQRIYAEELDITGNINSPQMTTLVHNLTTVNTLQHNLQTASGSITTLSSSLTNLSTSLTNL